MKERGFSLLELSIVLVIIGLIAGGIVAGASMIRAAELRAVITEQEQFRTATYTFRDKYLGLPGDLKNATAFWGEAHATAATCKTTASTGTETCNGDGNGRIEETVVSTQEWYRAWQHLANAGLISGTYTGVTAAGGANEGIAGENQPESKISGGTYTLRYVDSSTIVASPNFYMGVNVGNKLTFGTYSGTSTASQGLILKPSEAWGVDKKIDDGLPGRGKITTPGISRRANCATSDDASTAEYQLDNDVVGCNLLSQFD